MLLIASAVTNAQGTTEAGWRAGDVFALDTFCLSEDAALDLMNLLNTNNGNVVSGSPGCLNFPKEIPFILEEQMFEMLDWEGDTFYIWKVREFFRTNIYVLLWERPELPIPMIMQAI